MAAKYLSACALALLLASPNCLAWSEADTRRQVAYTALHVIDWGQTLDIAHDCHGGRERWEYNPVLGTCPGRGDVNRYFLATGLTHYAVSYALPPRYRRWWQTATITLQAGVVANNARIGLHMRF